MAAVGSPVWGSSVWGTGVWGANVWPGSGVEESASTGGGGLFVRDRKRRRPDRPARDIASPSTHARTRSFTPVIRDTTSTPNGPDLPALLAAWMAFEDH